MIGMECYIQRIFCYKYTTEPTVFNFGTTYIPPEYMSGHMLTGWEMPDPVTFVAHLRSDVYCKTFRRQTAASLSLLM